MSRSDSKSHVKVPTYRVKMTRGLLIAAPIIAGETIAEVKEKAKILAPQLLTRTRFPWMLTGRSRPHREIQEAEIIISEPVPHFYRPKFHKNGAFANWDEYE